MLDSIVRPPTGVSIVGRLVVRQILVEDSINLRLVGMINFIDFFYYYYFYDIIKHDLHRS